MVAASPHEPHLIRVTVDPLTFDGLEAGPQDGTPVVLLHGFPQTSAAWHRQMRALAAVGYRAVAVDQRGYSPGARPDDFEAYRIDLLGGDIVGIADELGLERFHVVGHDWGGFVAWWLAATHADRVASVVSVSTPHPQAFVAALRYPEQKLRSFYMPLLSSPRAAGVLAAGDVLGLRAVFTLSGLPKPLAEPYVERARSDPGLLPAALAWYRANTGTAMRALAGAGGITVPAMYVWSTRDSALGPYAAHLTGRYVSGPYRFEILSGVSHWIPEMAPDTLDRLLLDHLAGAPL